MAAVSAFAAVLVLVSAVAVWHQAGSRVGEAATRAPIAHPQMPQTAARLAALLSQPMPASNLWDLTRRLKLHRGAPIPRIVNSRSPNYPVEHTDTLWILNANSDTYHRVKATIVCETPHLYLYVQNSVKVSRAAACSSARFFENHIYPTDRAMFGSEWRPGVDDDPHVVIFYGHTPGVGGYFSGEDEYPRVVNRFSDQREIMFISSDDTTVGNADFNSTAAHEFQHMIHWHVHPQDEAWDNEGASVLAQVVNGFSSDGFDQAYASDPVQLDSWSDGNNSPNYGAGFLWMDYLYERFGRGFVHAMLADNRYSGIALATDILRRREHLSLNQVFGDWVVANFLNDRRMGPRFGYHNSDIRIPPRITLSGQSIFYRTSPHPYAPVYVAITPSKVAMTLHFHGARTIPVIGERQTAPFWWSNRCDFCDTSMTRSIHLGGTSRPVLTFKAWYGIETGYDYAYVEVSADGGITWYSLTTAVSSRSNPNGGNYGNGITGQSWHAAGNHGGWVRLKADLFKYRGKRIQLRFEYVTDDEYNGQSLAVKDIAIRSAHFRDTVGDGAWRLRGFVPVMRNALPLRWSIRMITIRRGSKSVKTVPVDSRANATIVVPSIHAAKRIALAIYSQAPKTTLSAAMEISSPATGAAP